MIVKTLINSHFLKIKKKISWNQVLQFSQNNVNTTFENYLNTVNTLTDSNVPLKKLNKKQKKFQQKPRITKGIQNSIEKKNKILKKCIKYDNCKEKIFHQEYKAYRNSLSTLLKESKKLCFNKYFKNSINNMKKTSKTSGIKSIISLNTKEFESSKVIPNNKCVFLTNPKNIANNFYNFSSSAAPTIQSIIKQAFKPPRHYLTEPCEELFLVSP